MKVQSLSRTFDILELLSKEQRGLALTDISERVDLHKSTVYRLLSSLMERGYIEKRDTKYKLGLQFVELCSLYLNSLELKTEAESVLRDLSLRTSQTTFLATLQQKEIVYIDKVEQFNSIRKYSIIGQRRPVYCTSLGKAFLMEMSNEEITSFLGKGPFTKYTEKTICAMEGILAEVQLSRSRGWAFDDEEYEESIQCIGAPILDYRGKTIAAVSSVWNIRQTDIKIDEIAACVMAAAKEISRHMGFH